MTTTAPLILVLVGTDCHPFSRLIDWTDRWYGQQPAGSVSCLVQHGASPAPRQAPGRDYWPREELDQLLTKAAVIVSHGGPSTIVESRRRGVQPIVVARSSARGEHVDDHQRRFARVMAERGLIHLVDDEASLHSAMSAAVTSPRRLTPDAVLEDPAVAARRLGHLVDGILAARRPGPRRPAA